MLRTWFLTVFSLMNSRTPMSRFVSPLATSFSTSSSRSVRRGAGTLSWSTSARRASEANSTMSLLAMDGEISVWPWTTARTASATSSMEISFSR